MSLAFANPPRSFMNGFSVFLATPTSPEGLWQLGPAQIHHTGIPNWEDQLGGVPIPALQIENEISLILPWQALQVNKYF